MGEYPLEWGLRSHFRLQSGAGQGRFLRVAASSNKQIEAFYLPSYSPELNPDERLNAGLKHALGTRVALRTKAKLKEATERHMAELERRPDRVRAYFGDPRVAYAA